MISTINIDSFLRRNALYLPGEERSDIPGRQTARLLNVLNVCGFAPEKYVVPYLNVLSDAATEQLIEAFVHLYRLDAEWEANAADFAAQPLSDSHSGLRPLGRYTDFDVDCELEKLLTARTPPGEDDKEDITSFLTLRPMFRPEGAMPSAERRIIAAFAVLNRQDDGGMDFLANIDDLLRLMWYPVTESGRLIRPKLVRDLYDYCYLDIDKAMKLKATRPACRRAARWIETLPQRAAEICESMHPHRGMWVRAIRALRLPEMARRYKLPKLAEVLDLFYRGDYEVWGGKVDAAVAAGDSREAARLLKQRPGAFARRLFSLALTLDSDVICTAFEEVADKVSLRLLYSLDQAADGWFFHMERTIIVPGCKSVSIAANRHLLSSGRTAADEVHERITRAIAKAIMTHYAKADIAEGTRIYIDPELSALKLPVGDRTNTMSALGRVTSGTSFPVKADRVTVFIHWGVGMPAQHYDMDLSAFIVGDDKELQIAYYNLEHNNIARHSGDYIDIPDQVGAAEYVTLDIPGLLHEGYSYALFSVNAYSVPRLADTLMAGWLSADSPFSLDANQGVSYNPADVEQLITFPTAGVARGTIFAALDLEARRMIWMQINNSAQTMRDYTSDVIWGYLRQLESKYSYADALRLLAQARHLEIVDNIAAADLAVTGANVDSLPLF